MSTLWKIKEFERILETRVNEEFVRDFFKAERENFQRDIMDTLNKQVPRLERKDLEIDGRVDALQRDLDKAFQRISSLGDDAEQRLNQAIEALRSQIEEQLKDSSIVDERVR